MFIVAPLFRESSHLMLAGHAAFVVSPCKSFMLSPPSFFMVPNKNWVVQFFYRSSYFWKRARQGKQNNVKRDFHLCRKCSYTSQKGVADVWPFLEFSSFGDLRAGKVEKLFNVKGILEIDGSRQWPFCSQQKCWKIDVAWCENLVTWCKPVLSILLHFAENVVLRSFNNYPFGLYLSGRASWAPSVFQRSTTQALLLEMFFLASLHFIPLFPLIDTLISARALQYSTPVLCEVILPRHVWLRVKCPPLRARTAAPGRQHHEYIIIPISILLPRQHFWSCWVIKSYITNTLIWAEVGFNIGLWSDYLPTVSCH